MWQLLENFDGYPRTIFSAARAQFALLYGRKILTGCLHFTETEAPENATICQNQHIQHHCTYDMKMLACDVR